MNTYHSSRNNVTSAAVPSNADTVRMMLCRLSAGSCVSACGMQSVSRNLDSAALLARVVVRKSCSLRTTEAAVATD